jgi:hypothetical protein
LTRHELKEQLQHDHFTDAVSGAVGYASSHRQALVRWLVGGALVLILAGGIWWYRSKQADTRREELGAAMSILDGQVGGTSKLAKTYPTEDAKKDAWLKAISGVASKYGGTQEGLIAQYYRGAARAQKDDMAGAESDLRAVANSSSSVTPLAKIALVQLYLGEKKNAEAQALLRELVKEPTPLVSKAQAQILQAQVNETSNPQAVKRATEQLNSQLAK